MLELTENHESKSKQDFSPFGTLVEISQVDKNERLLNTRLLAPSRNSREEFVKENVVSPVYNNLFATPINALVNASNFILPKEDAISKLPVAYVEPAEFGSSQWLCQSLSSGLSSAIVFGGLGRLGGRAFKCAGLRVTESQAMIASGTALEGLRDTQSGETHLGNMLAGATMLGIFESGANLTRSLSGWKLQCVRAGVGALGSSAQALTSSLVSRGALPENMISNVGTGAVMNIVLPAILGRPSFKTELKFDSIQQSTAAEPLTPPESLTLQEHASEHSLPVDSEPKLVSTGKHVEGYELGNFSQYNDYASYEEYVNNQHQYLYVKFKEHNFQNLPPIRVPVEAPEYKRLPVNEIAKFASELPNPELLKDITVLDYPHQDQAWLRKMSTDETLR
ncbi:MAG: hypothetical protein K2X81_08070, partial [Candidatus Obscuribacterales bacterium]|nr:hypothetical protein [Candidatus Obscuribacterales bacterium]